MTITRNGETTDTDARTVADLVADLMAEEHRGDGPPGVAVALNGDVVPRSAWSSTRLAPGDAVEIVTAVQGG